MIATGAGVAGAGPGRKASGRAARVARLLHHGLPRFLLVGCAGLATDGIAYSVLAATGAADAVARAASLVVATLVTWRLNRRFTFAASGRVARDEAARYAGVALCAQGFNYGLFLGLRAASPQLWPLAALAVSAACAAAFSFAGQSFVTFGSHGRMAEAATLLGSRR